MGNQPALPRTSYPCGLEHPAQGSQTPPHRNLREGRQGYAGRHLTQDHWRAKTLTQMGEEIGTHPKTIRRWLRRDHRALWMQHWPTANDILEEAHKARERNDRVDHELVAALDRSLEVLLSAGHVEIGW